MSHISTACQELGNLLKLVLQVNGQNTSSKMVKVARELDGIVERQSLRTLQLRAAPFMMRRLKKDVMNDLPEKRLCCRFFSTEGQQDRSNTMAHILLRPSLGQKKDTVIRTVIQLYIQTCKIQNYVLVSKGRSVWHVKQIHARILFHKYGDSLHSSSS